MALYYIGEGVKCGWGGIAMERFRIKKPQQVGWGGSLVDAEAAEDCWAPGKSLRRTRGGDWTGMGPKDLLRNKSPGGGGGCLGNVSLPPRSRVWVQFS